MNKSPYTITFNSLREAMIIFKQANERKKRQIDAAWAQHNSEQSKCA